MAFITLDRDSVGQLWLHREGDREVWLVPDGQQAHFPEDAVMLASGQAQRWQVERFPEEYDRFVKAEFGPTQRIVNWRSPADWEIVGEPGVKAMEYLGVKPDDVRGPGHPPVYLVARQRICVELPRTYITALDSLARKEGKTRTEVVERAIRSLLDGGRMRGEDTV